MTAFGQTVPGQGQSNDAMPHKLEMARYSPELGLFGNQLKKQLAARVTNLSGLPS